MMRRSLILLAVVLSLLPSAALSQNSKENADFKLAINLYTDGLYDLAAEQLKQFIASYPNTPQGIEARFFLALTQQKLKQYDNARMTFQTFALTYQDNPKAPEAWWNTGECYNSLRNYHEAALAYERVKVFHPKNKLAPEALIRSANAFLQAGEPDNARRVLRIVLQEYPSSPAVLTARTALASILVKEGNLEQAQTELKRVIDGDPSPDAKAQALLLLGNIHQATGKAEQAQADYQEIIQKYKSSSALQGAYFHLGRLFASWGQFKDAAENLRRASAETSQADSALSRDALTELGDALVGLKEYSAAVGSYEKYLTLSPGQDQTVSVLWKIARASALGKNFRKSNEAASRVLKLSAPDSLKRRAQVRLGLNAEEQKNFIQAVQLYSSFAEQRPDDLAAPEILLRAASLAEASLRDYRKASALYELLASRYERSQFIDDAIMGAARCQEQLKAFERAIPLYRRFVKDYATSEYAADARNRLRMIDIFEAKDKDSGLEKLALLVGDVVAQKDRAGLAYRLGEIYFSDLKNYQAASTQMGAALQAGLKNPMAREARYLRARALEYLTLRDESQRSAAIDAYEEYLGSGVTDERATEAALSMFALRAVTLAEARTAEREILSRIPSFKRADAFRLRIGTLLEDADSTNAALDMLGELVHPPSPSAEEAGFRFFRLLIKTGHLDSALIEGSSYIAAYPESPYAAKVTSELAERALATGNTEKSIECSRTLVTKYFYASEAKNADRRLANAYAAHGNYEEAIQIYDDLIQRRQTSLLDEKDAEPDLLLAMGKAQYLSGNFEVAKRYLFQVLSRERTGTQAGEAYTTLGMIARSAGALEEATAYFRQASVSSPTTTLTPDIADLLFQNGDYIDAIKSYTRLLQASRNDTDRELYESRIILSRLRADDVAGLDKDIIAFTKRYRGAKRELAAFELERGNYHFRRQDYVKALQAYKVVTSRYEDTPSAPEGLYRIAQTLEATNKPNEAIEQLNKLIETYPDAPILARAYLSLGNNYYTLEQWDEAIKSYRRIVDDPKADPALLPMAMSNLIETYQIAGANDAALTLARKYIELYPNSDDKLDKQIKIGILYERLGYYDQAVLHLQSLLDEAGSDLEGEIRYYIAEANYNKGDYQQAILDFLKVPYLVTKKGKLDWTANSLYMSGQAYEKMGRYDQALTMYQQIIDRSGIDEMFKTAARKEMERVRLVLKRKSN
jgi:TolA-binding protein